MKNTQKEKKTVEYKGFNRILRSGTIHAMQTRMRDGSIGEFIEDWKWILNYSKKHKWAIVLYTVLGILSSTLGLGASVLTKYTIDIIVNRKTDQIWLLAFLMVFSTIFSLLFSAVVNRMAMKISIRVHNDIQMDIFEKIMDAEWLSLNGYASGDLLNRFSIDVKSVAGNAINWIPDMLIQLYTFVMTFVVICYYDAVMAVIAFLSAPFLMFSSKYILRKTQEHRKRVLEVNSGKMGFEVEAFHNIDTIKSFGISDHYNTKLNIWQEKFAKSNLDYNLFSIQANTWMTMLTSMVGFVALAYCLFRLWTGTITYGTMTLFLQQRSKLSSNFDSLVKILPNMVNSSVAAHRVREIAELPKEQHNPEEAELLQKLSEHGLGVCLENVKFAYVAENYVLSSGNFEANPNEIVALVGPSGEGKTTILRMMLGLIHPQEGKAVLKTRDGREISMNADIRTLFSYVPQGNTLLSGTIAENLRLAKQDATEEEIAEALKIACAWEFVQKIEGGIHGKLGERGKGVSEGQAQRIAIARAILRDAPILLLDEATSALDVETERKVLKNIMKQRPNKTCIVTTHRPSVLNMCQRVYRVLDTKITELDEKTSSQMVQDF